MIGTNGRTTERAFADRLEDVIKNYGVYYPEVESRSSQILSYLHNHPPFTMFPCSPYVAMAQLAIAVHPEKKSHSIVRFMKQQCRHDHLPLFQWKEEQHIWQEKIPKIIKNLKKNTPPIPPSSEINENLKNQVNREIIIKFEANRIGIRNYAENWTQ